MKQQLITLMQTIAEEFVQQHQLEKTPDIVIERTRNPEHGDFACNLAMLLAKPLKRAPRDIAQEIVTRIGTQEQIDKVEIAGPGFINFYLSQSTQWQVVPTILTEGEQFGHVTVGADQSLHLEFVSANPTGPLHVGHGRSAAYGSALANLLMAAGFKVHKEYYVNDAGRQMHILAASIWLRYLSIFQDGLIFPVNAYHGDYVKTIAQQLADEHGERFLQPLETVFVDLPQDEKEDGSGDKELYIDAVITRAKQLLGGTDYECIFATGLELILAGIKTDLEDFGVTFDNWFREKQLATSGAIDTAISELKAAEHVYEKDGALWFKATEFGDEKDRVLIRENGVPTYFASDVAYHWHKFQGDYTKVIDILGADHHGYIARVKASLEALGQPSEKFTVLMVQFAILYRGKTRMQMSTRSGSFVTLEQLVNEVGRDAARFFYVQRKCEQHLDFDLELAKSQSNDNPVYYIQYAHTRICSVFRQLDEKQLSWDKQTGLAQLALLTEEHEQRLLTSLARYPELVASAALAFEPHQIAHYLRELANDFHTYYNAQQFIVDDNNLRQARLCLIRAVKHVLCNGLQILGISAPEVM